MRLQVRTTALAFMVSCGLSGNTALLDSTFAPQPARGELHYAWRGPAANIVLGQGGDTRIEYPRAHGGAQPVTLHFPGSNRRSNPRGEASEAVPARYYNESNPTGALQTQFRRIRYRGLYPGVDLIFHIEGASVEYDFELSPHASFGTIRMAYRGAAIRLTESGDIEIGANPAARTVQKPPQVRQMVDGVVTPVSCRYILRSPGIVSLALGNYDSTKSLTIDPVLNFTSILGGQGFEAAYATAVDAAGAIYIAGETDSTAFSNAGRRTSRDAFIAKLNPAGTGLQYVVYFGGSGAEAVRAIALDAAGNVYAAGTTTSHDFPATSGVVGPTNVGIQNAFVVKVTSGVILYATLLGSSGSDQAFGIAIDSSGSAYVTGQTNASFPTTSGAIQRTFRGGTDCFISKLSPNAGSLIYSTLLGGGNLDACRGIAVDSAGNAYVAGFTSSADFPVLTTLQNTLKGPADAFVAKINPTATALVYSTFLGGDGFDEANAIAIDSSGAAYVAGDTASSNFPVSYEAAHGVSAGGYDAFAAKLSPAGDALKYSTLIGGSGTDAATAIAVDASGRALIAGFTNSINLPLRQALQTAIGGLDGQFDAFSAVVDSGGFTLLFSSYLGGSGDDRAFGAALASGNRIYLTGVTQSPNFTNASAGAIAAGNSDIFVVQITYDNDSTTGLHYTPLIPCRIADTRTTQSFTGAFGPPYLKGNTIRTFTLPLSGCNIPASAPAYSLNVTALPRGPMLQYIVMWPAGQSLPRVSTLNAFDGRVVANAAIVPAGAGGAISIYVTEDTDLIIDINGYFGDSSSGFAFYTLNPCRIADTRGYGSYAAPFGTPYMLGNSARTFPIPQSPCAPSTTAEAYSFNITALPRKPMLQYLISWPTNLTMPKVSTLNSFNGQVVANAAILGAGTDGGIDVLTSEDADLLIDINGYFAPPGSPGALSFTPVTPCRVADTRQTTPIDTGASRTFDVPGSGCGIPASARAYSLNVTVLPATILQYLIVWPTGQPWPHVSTLNSFNGAVVANAAIVPAGLNGKIDILASEKTEVIIDINGYFAP